MLTILCSAVAIPASSALFNQNLIEGLRSLDVPAELKLQLLSDLNDMRKLIPSEYLDSVLEVVVKAINVTFLIGLSCSIICAISVFCIPWKPVVKELEVTDRGKEYTESL